MRNLSSNSIQTRTPWSVVVSTAHLAAVKGIAKFCDAVSDQQVIQARGVTNTGARVIQQVVLYSILRKDRSRARECSRNYSRMKTAVFIERDAILNEVRIGPKHQISPTTLEEFKINTSAIEPLKALKAAGFVLIATTNQPGVSRGTLSRRELDRMHDMLKRAFPLDDLLVCPHDEHDRCPCRKPKPGLLIEAAFKWHLDLDHSFVISDKWQDAEAARTAGCVSLLIKSPWIGPVHHDFILPDLSSVITKTLQLNSVPKPSMGPSVAAR